MSKGVNDDFVFVFAFTVEGGGGEEEGEKKLSKVT